MSPNKYFTLALFRIWSHACQPDSHWPGNTTSRVVLLFYYTELCNPRKHCLRHGCTSEYVFVLYRMNLSGSTHAHLKFAFKHGANFSLFFRRSTHENANQSHFCSENIQIIKALVLQSCAFKLGMSWYHFFQTKYEYLHNEHLQIPSSDLKKIRFQWRLCFNLQ